VNTRYQSSSGVRLAPRVARPNLAAELRLDHRDEVRSVERAPVRAAVHEPVAPRLLVERQFQEIRDVRERRAIGPT